MASERFDREARHTRLAEVPLSDLPRDADAPEASDLLTRLERQAAESGRLDGRVQTLERALRSERRAAEALHERASRQAAEHADTTKELNRLREAVAAAEQQMRMTWARLSHAEQQLAWKQRALWRKLFRRPPKP
jgi:predicted  nucleic acid-binding Zn-ribbon protein